MNVFCCPDDILLNLLSEWINALTIGKLDTAVCNKKKRLQLLRNLQIPAIKTINWDTEDHTNIQQDNFTSWVFIRNISLSCVCLKPTDLMKLTLTSTINLNKVIILDLRFLKTKYFQSAKQLINSCPKVVDLRLNMNALNVDLLFSEMTVMKQLTRISIVEIVNCFSDKSLYFIASQCTDLRCIKLHCNSKNYITQNVLSLIFEMNKQIEHVDIDLHTDRFLHFIETNICRISLMSILTKHCLNLKYATLYEHEISDFSVVSQLILQCKNIQKLNFGWDGNWDRDTLFYEHSNGCKRVIMNEFMEAKIDNVVDFFTKITRFTVIELMEWVTLTDTILTNIITNNKSTLQSIKINYCGENWTIHPIVKFMESNQAQLTSLTLQDCHHLNDDDFARLFMHKNALKYLIIDGCKSLYTITLLQLLAQSSQLKILKVYNCENILISAIHNFCVQKQIEYTCCCN
jgi:hypothetical protein